MTNLFRQRLAATRLLYSQAIAVELMYRFSLVQGFIGIVVGFVGLIFFWLAAASTQTGQALYPANVLISYFVLTSCHTILHENRISFNVSMAIRMGKMSASLLRPYPWLLTVFAQAFAHATIRLLILAPLFAAVFLLITPLRPVITSVTADQVLLYVASIFLSLIAGWTIKVVIGLLAFDMTQTWGPELIFLSIYSFASGVAFPVDLVPAWLYSLIEWTPVYYMVGFPALILLGRLSEAQLASGFLHGGLVTLMTCGTVWLMWRRGLHKFEAVGI